ncbi:MAG: hypothetical protein J6Y02_19845, partial [Pseudobutyrivibrio sp.]|nr:hypothetical protein [Pseudobutyrivibrio sp.]
IAKDSPFFIKSGEHNNTWTIPAGTYFKYDKSTEVQGHGFVEPIEKPNDFKPYSSDYYADGIYYFISLYDILLSVDPFYCSYYLTIVDTRSYFENDYLNPNMFMGFAVTTNHLERRLFVNYDLTQYPTIDERNLYRFEFKIRQSVLEDFGLYNPDIEPQINNMKVFMIIDKDGVPYRYFEGYIPQFKNPDNPYEYADPNTFEYTWWIDLKTDDTPIDKDEIKQGIQELKPRVDQFDSENNIKIINGYELNTTTQKDGYFKDNETARIYILGKFSNEYGRHTLDSMIPGLEGYTLINVYKVTNGIDFYNNFTSVMNTRVKQTISDYEIYGVPFIGAHYFYTPIPTGGGTMEDESKTQYFIHELIKKKSYIDHCLTLVENNMDIDFKYFNTYGESKTYFDDDPGHTDLGHIDINMKFKVKLINANDVQTKNAIIQYIKSAIENLNDSGEDLHIPNLIHDLTAEFRDAIVYIDFVSFNNNQLGVNHIELKEITDIHTVPEFICIRNRLTDDGTELEPWIDLEIVK